VHLARDAITHYLKTRQLITSASKDKALSEKSGIFVTLNTMKPLHELRGCIGFPYPEETLVDATVKAAVYAATQDPRFPPVSLQEFEANVVVEITVLTPPRPLNLDDRRKLPDLIQVGRDGLIVEGAGTSGLLLPQVATEWNWNAEEFLTNCCIKAGLPPDSWLLDGISVKTFQGEIFEELEPSGNVRHRPIRGTKP